VKPRSGHSLIHEGRILHQFLFSMVERIIEVFFDTIFVDLERDALGKRLVL
jgi:hypothetical protein